MGEFDEDELYIEIERDFDQTIKNYHEKIKQINAQIQALTDQREQTLRVYREHMRYRERQEK